MLAVFSLLAPVFSLVLVGGLSVRLGLFAAGGLVHLNRFVLVICVPVLIFSALLSTGSFSAMNWAFIAIYVAVALLLNLITGMILYYWFDYPAPQAAMLSMGGGTANSLFLGYPIALLVFPEDAAKLFAWIILGDALLIIPITTGVAEFTASGGSGKLINRIFKPILRNPVVVGLVAGFAYLLVDVPLPKPIESTRVALVQAAPPLALFIIGGLVATTKLTRVGPPIALIGTMKLIVHPLIMFAALMLIPVLEDDMARKAVLFTAMPMFTIYTVFAERFGEGGIAASTLLVTTIMGAATVGFALSLLGLG